MRLHNSKYIIGKSVSLVEILMGLAIFTSTIIPLFYNYNHNQKISRSNFHATMGILRATDIMDYYESLPSSHARMDTEYYYGSKWKDFSYLNTPSFRDMADEERAWQFKLKVKAEDILYKSGKHRKAVRVLKIKVIPPHGKALELRGLIP
ncbi:hypothetical protein ACFL35_01415 [Candidatus Riflebacteria bacterium]